jgi:hypothetical protein
MIGPSIIAITGMLDALSLYSALGSKKEPYDKDTKMNMKTYDIGSGWTASVEMKEQNGQMLTAVRLCSPDKECKDFKLALPLGRIQKRVLKYLANNTGWGWSDIKKSARSITSKVGAKRMAKLVNKIVTDPRFKSGMGFAGTIYPPLGISYGAVRASANIITAARQGDVKAQEAIITIADRAKAGDPKAAKIARAMMSINQVAKKGADVSGWAWNLPYRGNVEAASFDKSNPFHAARKMYHEGLTLGLK